MFTAVQCRASKLTGPPDPACQMPALPPSLIDRSRRRLLSLLPGAALSGVLSRAWAARSETGTPRLMQGPMLGACEPDRLRIWARTSEPLRLGVEVSPDEGFRRIVARSEAHTRAEDDGVAQLQLGGLSPATGYFYRLTVNGRPAPYLGGLAPFRARTAPTRDSRAPLRIAFGSCARYAADAEQRIWSAVTAREPELFLWLGDNIYGDSLIPATLAEEYRRQRGVPGFQALGANVPQLAIWDDHDYGLNDHDRENPVKEQALSLFRRWWANPAYGLAKTPGVFFRYRYGAVELFMLDSRYHRAHNDAADTPSKSMLGAGQRQWLEAALADSDAIFKLIACGSGWSSAKGPGGDSWAAFLHERDALFEYIRERGIEGVVLLSGDTHTGELNAIPWSDRGGYDLYDLVSSPLAQRPEQDWVNRRPELRIRQPFDQDNNFGLLEFAFEPEPLLRYTLIDSRGRAAFEPLLLHAADLRNGVASWPSKIDPALAPTRSMPSPG